MMDRKETIKLLDKITTFRQSFLVKKDTVDNWHKVLKDYDYKDVDDKLDDYFRESKNFGQYPDPYYLTKYLTKTKDKNSKWNMKVQCSICGKLFSQEQLDEHFDRCSSIDYVFRMYRKHYNKKINRNELWELPNETFDKMYWAFCEKLYNELPDGLEKKCLENAIRSHKGLEIRYNLDDLTKKSLEK